MKTDINNSVVKIRSNIVKLSGYRHEKGRAKIQKDLDKITSYSKIDYKQMYDIICPLPPLQINAPIKKIGLLNHLFGRRIK